jgi:hypothetical protein
VGDGGGAFCRAARTPGAERSTTGADRWRHHLAHGRARLGTGDPPLAERAQCLGGIAGGRPLRRW